MDDGEIMKRHLKVIVKQDAKTIGEQQIADPFITTRVEVEPVKV